MEVVTRPTIQNLVKDLRDKLRETLRTQTARNVQLVLVSQILSGALGFAANLLLIRGLSVASFGLFSLFNSMFMMIFGIMHLGWADTYVRFGSIHRTAPFFPSLRRHSLKWVAGGSTVFAALLLLFAPHVIEHIFHRRESLEIFYSAVLLALISTWLMFFLSEFRVHSNYRSLAGVNCGPQIFRLLIFVPLFAMSALTLNNTIATYFLITLTFVVLCAVPYFKNAGLFQTASEPVPSAVRREMTSYNGWMLFNLITFNVIGNVDAQIIAHYQVNQSIAEFSVAGRLALPFYLIITAINTAVLPRLSASHTVKEIKTVISKLTLVILPLTALIAAIALFGVPWILWIAGPHYAGITTLMRLQLLCTLLTVLWYPLSTVLLAMGRAKSIALLGLAQLAIDLILDFAWIPHGGAEGAVRASVVIHLLGLLWTVMDLSRQIRIREKA